VALTGLKYWSDLVGFDTGSFYSYLDFNSDNYSLSGSNLLLNSPDWIPPSTGIVIGNSTYFDSVPGSGNFSGNYVKLLGNFALDNWTVITLFDFQGAILTSGGLSWNQISTNWENWTQLWNNSTLASGSGFASPYNKILFSAFPSGQSGTLAANSGYFCGINGANKLFFSYYNSVDGPQIFTYTGFIPSKSIISVSKQDNNLNLGIYEPNNSSFNFQQFGIFGSNITINSDWYIGGAPQKPNYYPTLSNLTGFVDEFILLSGDAYQGFLNVLPSGFWSEPTGYTSGTYVITGQETVVSGVLSLVSGISGYINIPINCVPSGPLYFNNPLYQLISGETGSYITQSGILTDACGNNYPNYVRVSQSGLIPFITGYDLLVTGYEGITCENYLSGVTGLVTGIVYQTGVQFTYTTGASDIALGFQYDIPFFNSLGMEGLTIFYEIKSGNDVFEYFANNVNDLDYANQNNDNRGPQFSTTSNLWVTDQLYSGKTIPLWRNGQLQLESGFFAYPSGYSTAYILSGDYFLNGRNIESTGVYTDTDLMVYDYNPSISGNSWLGFYTTTTGNSNNWNEIITNWNLLLTSWNNLSLSASGFTPFTGSQFTDFIYVNGQKMTSGVNINSSGQLVLNLTGTNIFQFIRISGLNSLNSTYNQVLFDTGSANTQKFLKQTSISFYNGIRQSLNNDYVERGFFDRLTGNYYQRDFDEILYNNTKDFYNI